MPIQRKTTAQFVIEAQSVHGDKYDYSEAEYVNTHVPVKIKCLECGGVFLQEPSSHLAGHGCPKCNKKQTQRRVDQATFIARAKKVHGDKYDYSKVEYKDMRSKVEIVCPHHGAFWQRAQSHLLGNGCPECKREAHIARIKQMMASIDAQSHSNQSKSKENC